MLESRRLINHGPTEPCESCGTLVRVSQYEGSAPRLNEVRAGRDLPGGHTPQACQDARRRD